MPSPPTIDPAAVAAMPGQEPRRAIACSGEWQEYVHFIESPSLESVRVADQ